MSRLKTLQNKHASVVAQWRAIISAAEKDNDRDLNEAEQQTVTTLKAQAEKLVASIADEKVLQEAERQLGTVQDVNADPPPKNGNDVKVGEDRSEKKPWRSFGEFLVAVYHAAVPGMATDPRLQYAAATGLSEGVPSDGGFLVGKDMMTELLQNVYENGEILSRVRKVEIGANSNGLKMNAVDETSRATGSRWGGVRGYWVAEAGLKTESKPKFRQMELELKKLAVLMYSTDELLQDSTALESVLEAAARDEITFLTELSIISGTGAGQPLGVLNSPSLVTVAAEGGQTADTVVLNNVVKMWARLWSRSKRNAIWLINGDAVPTLFNMVGADNANVYFPPGGITQSPNGTLLGRPVIETEYNATVGDVGDIILMDPSQYLLITKGGIQQAQSMHVRFIYDESVFRFVYRVDGQPIWNSPLTPFNGSATVSPFVALAAR